MNKPSDPGFEFVKQLGYELASNDFDLPPFPDTALKIRKALNDPDVSIGSVSDIIISEPALTARLMLMANSAMMRRGTLEITDIKTAISRIGLDMVMNAAVSLATKEAFKASAGSPLREQLDRIRAHSIRVSALAYILAQKVENSGKPDEAMLAGLLHAIGKFYILMRVDKYPELFSDSEALDKLINEWHAGIGRAIVESWGFPDEIVEAVDEHELIDRQRFGPADITDIVIVANLLAKADEEQDSEQPELDKVPSLLRMMVDVPTIRNFIQASDDEIRSMTQALNT